MKFLLRGWTTEPEEEKATHHLVSSTYYIDNNGLSGVIETTGDPDGIPLGLYI